MRPTPAWCGWVGPEVGEEQARSIIDFPARLSPALSPGAAGVAAMAFLGVAWTVAPKAWLDALPPGKLLSAAAIVFGSMILAVATREPARF